MRRWGDVVIGYPKKEAPRSENAALQTGFMLPREQPQMSTG
jgi:hypothetical protein